MREHNRQQRQETDGHRGRDQPAPGLEPVGETRQAPPATGFLVGDHVDVDRPRQFRGGDADPGAEHLGEAPPPAGSEHQLGGVLRAGEVQQRGRDVVTDDVVVGAAEAFHQRPLVGECLGVRPGQSVGAGDVHREQVGALAAVGDPDRPTDQRVALGPTGESDDDPFPGFPGAGYSVFGPVPVELFVDLVRDPQQRDLPQRGEVAHPEVVRQRRVDLLGSVDVTVRHPPAQRLRCHVDQLHLVGLADDLVGHRFPLRHPGNRLDDVVERLHVLDVDVGDDVDTRLKELLDVLPALCVAAAGDVGVRELVDKRNRGPAFEHGVHVHLGERRTAVGDLPTRDDFQPLEQRDRLGTTVGLDEADDHVGTPFPTPVRLVKGGKGLAHARRRAEVDTQGSPTHDIYRAPSRPSCAIPRRRRVTNFSRSDRVCRCDHRDHIDRNLTTTLIGSRPARRNRPHAVTDQQANSSPGIRGSGHGKIMIAPSLFIRTFQINPLHVSEWVRARWHPPYWQPEASEAVKKVQ